jgi:glycosyltransferase involved in cell wall biosynthesis
MPRVLIICPNTNGHRQNYLYVISRIFKERDYEVVCALPRKVRVNQSDSQSVLTKTINEATEVIVLGESYEGIGVKGELVERVQDIERMVAPEWTFFPTCDEVRIRLAGLGHNSKPYGTKRAGVFIFTDHVYDRDFHSQGHIKGTINYLRYRRWQRQEAKYFKQSVWNSLGLDIAFTTNVDFQTFCPKFILLPEIYRAWGAEAHGMIPEINDKTIAYKDFLKRNIGRTILIYYGSCARRRGYQDLVRLAAEDPEYALVIHGSPIEGDLLRKESIGNLIKLKNEDRLFESLTPFYPENELVDTIFNSCHFVVLPYHEFYGQSGSLIQATSFGKPVVAPDVGWMGKEVKRYGIGESYRHGDYGALKSTVSKMKTRYARYSTACQQYSKRHSFDCIRDVIEHELIVHS